MDISREKGRNEDTSAGLAGGLTLGLIGAFMAMASGMEVPVIVVTGLMGLMMGSMGGKFLQKQFSNDDQAHPSLSMSQAPQRDPVSLQAALDKGASPQRSDSLEPAAPPTPLETRVSSRHIS